jgi:hypothetical protein
MKESNMVDWTETVQRLEAVAAALEQTAARIADQQVALAAEAPESVGRIVATVDHRSESAREAELERRLEEAEARIAELKATASPAGRKTLPSGMASMLAKQGVTVESMEAGALDGALSSLSIEQRIAVKAELLRAGLLG